ncbi:phosphonate ABC transporter ATP-binding protein [Stenotrophomonas indicatrix]
MIEVRNLSKRYGGNLVLEDISFSIAPGEFVVVLGPSGAGKSTLLRCIKQLTEPTSGQVLVEGQPCIGQGRRAARRLSQRIAMVFQQHHLTSRLSVLKNVLVGRMSHVPLWACLLQLFPRRDLALAMDAIDQVGLADKARERADRLSGGQQQRVGIARALAQEPELILADEPVASLDPKSSRSILTYMRQISQRNRIAVLCNLHQIEYAMEFGQRILGISGGRIVFDGPPEALTPAIVASIYPGLADDRISRLVMHTAAELRQTRLAGLREATP